MTDTIDIKGLIVSEKHAGNGKREILLQEASSVNAPSFTLVLLDGATNSASSSKWFTVKKARNLLSPGVGLHVERISGEGKCRLCHLHRHYLRPSKQTVSGATLFLFSASTAHFVFI